MTMIVDALLSHLRLAERALEIPLRPIRFGLYSSIASPPRGEHLDRCVDEVIAEAQ